MRKIQGFYFYTEIKVLFLIKYFYRIKKRKWVHEINLERMEFGEFHTLMPQLRQDEKRFYLYFRMSSKNFDEILNLVNEDISKMDTNYREAISAEERLAIALR